MKYILIGIVKIYQKLLSFDHGIPHKLFPGVRVCIYHPSCSEYTVIALKKYGTFIGGYMAIRRIISCGPWSAGGFDPVKEIELKGWKKLLTYF